MLFIDQVAPLSGVYKRSADMPGTARGSPGESRRAVVVPDCGGSLPPSQRLRWSMSEGQLEPTSGFSPPKLPINPPVLGPEPRSATRPGLERPSKRERSNLGEIDPVGIRRVDIEFQLRIPAHVPKIFVSGHVAGFP